MGREERDGKEMNASVQLDGSRAPREGVQARVLLVDDEEGTRQACQSALSACGFEVASAATAEGALAELGKRDFDLALVDGALPGVVGLLEVVKESRPGVIVAVVGQGASAGPSSEKLRKLAREWLEGPLLPGAVGQLAATVLSRRKAREDQKPAAWHYRDSFHFGDSTAIRKVLELARRFSDSDANLLISGEAGTGKEVLARSVHYNSSRALRPFIRVDLPATPSSLLEVELFGCEGGAMQGLSSRRIGCFELAGGGTLFLDEVTAIPLELQAKVLRAIEGGKIRRVGSRKATRIDVRVVAATARDIEKEVEGGRFREELYMGLNVLRINIPPLRDRKEDIRYLAGHFAKTLARQFKKSALAVSEEATQLLLNHPWPGNVRELYLNMERAVASADGEMIGERGLLACLAPATLKAANPLGGQLPAAGLATLEGVKREYIRKVVEACEGNRKKAAKILGITPVTIWRKLGGREKIRTK